MEDSKDKPISIDDLKATNYIRKDPPIYKPLRRISIRISYWCIHWHVSPHLLTLLSFLSALVAAILLASSQPVNWMIAGGMLVLSYIFDCMDGEVARGSKRTSIIGSQLEHIFHWLIIGTLQIGVTLGVYQATGNWTLLMLSLLSIIGWYSFYFLYLQLRMWINPSARFVVLRRWSRFLFNTMPLDENLLIFFCIVGNTPIYVWISGILSLGLFCTTFIFFVYYQTRGK